MVTFARPLPKSPTGAVRELPVATMLDDAVLVARACEGDRWAEEALYHRHFDYVMGMVVRLLGHRDEAEDVVQDTFAIALDRLSALRQADSVRAWFAQIAVSQVGRRLRKAKVLSKLGLYPPIHSIDLDSIAVEEVDPEARAELATIGRILANLPANVRIAWMLRYVDGEPLADVAHLCGCSLATVKRRIAAAAKHLGNHIRSGEELR
jgi:RNA polymerase sigma-70 factor (ECF subfamily)